AGKGADEHGHQEDPEIVGHEGDQGNRRARADAGHAPADAEEGSAANEAPVDMAVFGGVESGVKERRAAASCQARGDEHDDEAGRHYEGEAGVPAAARDGAEIEEAQDLEWIDHLGDVKAGAEQDTAEGGGGEIRKLEAGHQTIPVTATVTMAMPKKTATATS